MLIVGASGNVGPFAVQIAKSMGAHVTGVARGSKLDFVQSLGADEVIDYQTTDYTRTGARYDWILDTDSHRSIFQVRQALTPDGVYVTLGGGTWPIWMPWSSDRSCRSSAGSIPGSCSGGGRSIGRTSSDSRRCSRLEFRPAIDRRYSPDQAVDALRWVDDGKASGKVIVIVDQDGPA